MCFVPTPDKNSYSSKSPLSFNKILSEINISWQLTFSYQNEILMGEIVVVRFFFCRVYLTSSQLKYKMDNSIFIVLVCTAKPVLATQK